MSDINFPKYANIEIKNMVVTGKFNFKKFLSCEEIEKIIENSYLGWTTVNQETTPQLCTYIIREDESRIYFQLWHTGRVYMAGFRSEKEIKTYFNEIIKELREIVPSVFNNNHSMKGGANKKE